MTGMVLAIANRLSPRGAGLPRTNSLEVVMKRDQIEWPEDELLEILLKELEAELKWCASDIWFTWDGIFLSRYLAV